MIERVGLVMILGGGESPRFPCSWQCSAVQCSVALFPARDVSLLSFLSSYVWGNEAVACGGEMEEEESVAG